MIDDIELLESLTQDDWNVLLSSDVKNLCKYIKYCKHQLPLNELLEQVPELEIYFNRVVNYV